MLTVHWGSGQTLLSPSGHSSPQSCPTTTPACVLLMGHTGTEQAACWSGRPRGGVEGDAGVQAGVQELAVTMEKGPGWCLHSGLGKEKLAATREV